MARADELQTAKVRPAFEGTIMDFFIYRDGPKVPIPRFASVPYEFTPRGQWARHVQELINRTDPWLKGEDPSETERYDDLILPTAVPSVGRAIIWGVHRKHKARRPQLSPFIDGHYRVLEELIGFITIEIAGTPEAPRLVRAYSGDYKPPLPWMASAIDAEGGKDACRQYWRTHAYSNRRNNLIGEGTHTPTPPRWYTQD